MSFVMSFTMTVSALLLTIHTYIYQVSKFPPQVVTNLLKTRENQPCRSIVYYPGMRMDSHP